MHHLFASDWVPAKDVDELLALVIRRNRVRRQTWRPNYWRRLYRLNRQIAEVTRRTYAPPKAVK